jgi:alpha-N-arabinofuranosidase
MVQQKNNNLSVKILLVFLFISLQSGIIYGQIDLSETAKEHYYTNPILKGMNPDPSICRVGDDYYMVTSTFGFFPGLPIYHSKDMVNWERIGYGIHDSKQLGFREGTEDNLNLYAATIRHHNGIFYIINTNVGRRDEDRNFIITATNPAGPWSKAHYIKGAPRIDPSLFFDDDGKVYYTGNDVPENPAWKNHRNIWMQELDINTWKLTGKKVTVLDPGDYYRGVKLTGQDTETLNHYEGPHVYKKDGMYYLLVSHGGTFWEHAVSIWKSDNIFGPYEYNDQNPIVTNRDYPHDNYIHHTGHADLVETQNGEWMMVLLGIRPYGGEFTNIGRETCMVPVDWSGVWPTVNPLGPKGRVMPMHRKPNLPTYQLREEKIRDDFNKKELELYWNFIQVPKEKWWDLSNPKGKLNIKLRPFEVNSYSVNPSFVARRQKDKSFTVITKMEFSPESENEMAGLLLSRDVNNQFQLVSTLKNGEKHVQLIRKEVVNDTSEVIIAEQKVNSKDLYLKIDALEQQLKFSVSEDGKKWKILADRQDASFLSYGLKSGRFTGTFIGMYATSKGRKSNNFALFDWFEYTGF